MNRVTVATATLLMFVIICWLATELTPSVREGIEKIEPYAMQLNSALSPEGSDKACLTGGGCPRIAYVTGNNALTIFTKTGWNTTSNIEEATLIWCRKHRGTRHQRKRQIINQIPAPMPIGDKAFLSRHVRVYEGVNLCKETWLPHTILLTTMDEMRWLSSFSKREDESKGIWIVKKTSQSMGRGITIIEDLSRWVRTEAFSKIAVEISSGERYVCQQYIQNPLLLEQRKSELRLYWTISSLEPLIVAVHSEGQVRLNSELYESSDYSNPRKHLTNAHQQEKHPEYERLMASGKLKWTFAKWRSHLLSEGVSNSTLDNVFVSMKLAIVRAVNATRMHLMGRANTIGMFEMFGADFIISSDFTVYLTEIQQGPGLSSTDPVKGKIIQSAVTGSADMALDLMTRRQQNKPLGEMRVSPGYEVVINEALTPCYYLSK